MGSFSRRVTSAVSFCFLLYSVMPQDEPISSGVGPEVQEAIKRAFLNLSADLTTVIESRVSALVKMPIVLVTFSYNLVPSGPF